MVDKSVLPSLQRGDAYFRYIEFYHAMLVPMPIALSGQLLLNQLVMVKPSKVEKNLVQSTTTVQRLNYLIKFKELVTVKKWLLYVMSIVVFNF